MNLTHDANLRSRILKLLPETQKRPRDPNAKPHLPPKSVPAAHTQTYFSPIPAIHLQELQEKREALSGLLLARDGALGVAHYFYEHPLPRELDQILLINARLSHFVPERWRETVAFYSQRLTMNRDHELEQARKIYLIFTVTDQRQCSLSFIERVASELKTFYGKRFSELSIHCVALLGRGKLSARFGFTQAAALLAHFGSNLEFLQWEDLKDIALTGAAFVDLNETDFHYSLSAIVASFLRGGAIPFYGETASGGDGIWVTASPFHGYEISPTGAGSAGMTHDSVALEIGRFTGSTLYQLEMDRGQPGKHPGFASLCESLATRAISPLGRNREDPAAPLRMKTRLDAVSPSFCLAKWLQVTLHLQMGHTQSCHHTDTHRVPLAELQANPSALHNTSKKKEFRKMMLEGVRPSECGFCWNVEDIPGNHISDRHIKSSDPWAEPEFENVRRARSDANPDPTYMEVSFSNTCNMKCAYCAPHISSKWMEEIRSHGPYQLGHDNFSYLDLMAEREKQPIPESEDNPYVEAFWKWWPDLYPKLKVFRITGGEPLLSKNTFKAMEFIDENPRSELELGINTNLTVPDKLISRLITRANGLMQSRKLARLSIYTSIDTWGEQAAYIRHGMDFNRFIGNVERILTEAPLLNLSFMTTFNALSPPSFRGLLEAMLSWRQRYGVGPDAGNRLFFDFTHLSNPEFLNVKILTPDFTEQVLGHLRFMEENSQPRFGTSGFSEVEISKMRRIHDWMRRPEPDAWVARRRLNFFRFFTEHDRRRGTNFLQTFPELTEFWETCRAVDDNVNSPIP